MFKIKIYKAAVLALSFIAIFAAYRNYREYNYICEAGRALTVFNKHDSSVGTISTSSLIEKLLGYDGLSIISIDSRDSGLQSVKIEYKGSLDKAGNILNEVSSLTGVIALKSINQAFSGDESKISAEIIYLSNIICK